MKKKSQNLLRNQTFITIIANMAVAFFITTAILIVYFNDYVGKNQTKIIYLSAEKKLLELNSFFNSAENIVNQYEDFILQTLDEDKILEDSDYEAQYMENVSRMMASAISDVQKGTVCPYFRMNIEKYGPTRGVFLTGSYKKSFVNIRTTDLSKYSPSDTEHVGWYYLPLWKKAPVWTPPYENLALGQKMISYSVPIYREDRFIGVVGIDLSLAIIDDMVKSFQIENSTGLLIGTEQNLINLETQEDLSKAVEHSAELAEILEQFSKSKNQKLKRFIWDGAGHYGIL
ncbi:MAG: hypothetical protein K6A43_01810, partial [Treponema sp.]|nr:hypothetical protein [Treponema sp.]